VEAGNQNCSDGVIEVSRDKTHLISLGNKKVSLFIAVLIAFLAGVILGRFLFGSKKHNIFIDTLIITLNS
jgi:hypothetical protein